MPKWKSSDAWLRSGPWESHPCRVLRQLRREVSLSLALVFAVAGSKPVYFCIGMIALKKDHREPTGSAEFSLMQGKYLMNVYSVFKVP